jgi:hypothetical protein
MSTVKVVIAWVMAVLGAIGAGIGTVAGLELSGHRASSYHASSALAAQIDQLAVNEAVCADDHDPTSVSWVRSTRERTLNVLMQSGGGGQYDAPVIAIEMRGSFTWNGSVGVLPGSGPSSPDIAPVMQVIFSLDHQIVTDYGIAGTWVPLGQLGKPETDSLVGLPPTACVNQWQP